MTQPLAKLAIALLDDRARHSITFVAEFLGLDCVAFTWWLIETVTPAKYTRYVCSRGFDMGEAHGRCYRQRMGSRHTNS